MLFRILKFAENQNNLFKYKKPYSLNAYIVPPSSNEVNIIGVMVRVAWHNALGPWRSRVLSYNLQLLDFAINILNPLSTTMTILVLLMLPCTFDCPNKFGCINAPNIFLIGEEAKLSIGIKIYAWMVLNSELEKF